MRINFLIKIFIVASGIALISGCNTMKHGKTSKTSESNPEQVSAQTSGLGTETGFADQTSANKSRAPFDQTYYFDLDKDNIHQADVASINAQAAYLIEHTNAKVRVEGHADERGSREYNVALGWRRAKTVVAILKQQGVASSQIAIVSYGKEKPAAFGHDEASYSLNRRVNFIYESK